MKNGIKENSKPSDRATLRRLPHMIFKIVIVHENLPAALRGKELADRLAASFSFEIATEVDYWKFDWLNWSPFREQAAEAATRADIVIFSTANNDMPPLGIQTWIESWLPGKQTAWSAVVALVSGGRAIPIDARRLSRYLQELAAKAKIDFFSNAIDKPDQTRKRNLESLPWEAQSRLGLRSEPLNLDAIVNRCQSFSSR